jgi:hypothetical protein
MGETKKAAWTNNNTEHDIQFTSLMWPRRYLHCSIYLYNFDIRLPSRRGKLNQRGFADRPFPFGARHIRPTPGSSRFSPPAKTSLTKCQMLLVLAISLLPHLARPGCLNHRFVFF